MQPNLQAVLDITVTIARGAGEILRAGVADATRGSIDYKTSEIDPVTEYDRRSEAYIVGELQRHFPHDSIVGEEGGDYERDSNPASGGSRKWFVDPIDGTVNFAHGIPIFSVSLGLLVDGVPSVGVVYNPMTNELFAATRGGGATLNGSRILVSPEHAMLRSLLITGFPYDRHTSAENNFDHFMNFKRTVQAVRRLGSAALDLCFVACGRADGYWELKLKPHDIAAGILIVREAGGQVTDFAGREALVSTHDVVASNGHIHHMMTEILQQKSPNHPRNDKGLLQAGDGI